MLMLLILSLSRTGPQLDAHWKTEAGAVSLRRILAQEDASILHEGLRGFVSR